MVGGDSSDCHTDGEDRGVQDFWVAVTSLEKKFDAFTKEVRQALVRNLKGETTGMGPSA